MITGVLDAFLNVEEVDHIVLQNFAFLMLPQIRAEDSHSIVSRQWELDLIGASSRACLALVSCHL